MLQGQTPTLAKLPKGSKKAFLHRLYQCLTYEKQQEWKKQFPLSIDYISDQGIPFIQKEKITEDSFVSKKQAFKQLGTQLNDFLFEGILLTNKFENDTQWLVVGCANFSVNNHRRTVRASITAIYHNNQWYFSDVSVLLRGVGDETMEIKCKIRKSR